MEIRKLHETAWEISNFISEEETSVFLDYIKTSQEADWYADMATGHWAGRSLLMRDT